MDKEPISSRAAPVPATPRSKISGKIASGLTAVNLMVAGITGCATDDGRPVVTADAGSTSVDVDLNALQSTIPWGKTMWDGYGKVGWNPKLQELVMIPKSPNGPNEEHSALVVSNQIFKQPFRMSFTMNTIAQLRTGAEPNEWEVGWAVFGFEEGGKFKYATLKTNGLEIGESLLDDKQTFPYTAPFTPGIYPIGADYRQVIEVRDNVISVTVNGEKIKDYTMFAPGSTDTLPPDGRVGFYSEDAAVKVSDIVFEQL